MATGNGAPGSGNVTIAGSNVNANDVMLAARNQINVVNTTDTDSTRASNSSSSASVGVQYTLGGGFGVSASMANAHGDSNSDASIQNASHVNGANSVTVISGGDTNIIGSQVNGKQVAADVGGNLNIVSVQDVTNSAAHQSSTGGGFTISQGGGSASFSAQNGHADSNYAGVNEQAGINAGTGGFDISVKGNTDLKGGVIASAADASQNSLTTGTLTYSDIQNHSHYAATSNGISAGIGIANTGKSTGPGSVSNGGGVSPMLPQNESGDQSATTRSAVAAGTINVTDPALPNESPCFRVDSFALDVPSTLSESARKQGASALPQDAFAFARAWLNHYKGQCVGKASIDILVKGLQQAILSRGYVTTRVLVPPQELARGTLSLSLVPGTVREVRFADATLRGTWKTAFPTRSGDLLNLRDLEQGIEQMKHAASQDAAMQIEPTGTPGESDVVITVKRAKPWTFVTSIDNSGTDATGKWQGNVSLGVDNPLGLNDVLALGANQDLSFGNKELGSHGFNGSYSIPWGYWTATLSGNTNTYYQQIAGNGGQVFVSSGNAQTAALRLARVLSRRQNDVLGAYVQLSKRFGESFIEDTSIPLQHRNNTFLELGATDRHYFSAAQFDGTLVYRQGIGGFGATPDPTTDDGSAQPATYRFHMAVLDVNLSVPFAVGGQRFAYVGTLHGQYTGDTLFYIDDLTIGGRYTVRGFDGNAMLAGERGFYWRNEFQWLLLNTGQTLYAGIDYGRVFGPGTALQPGTQLAGAVVGIRGGIPEKWAGFTYDLFAGTPVYKPSGFSTDRFTVGVQATAQF